jgi:excisionase family DNA binding protein
LFPLIFPFFFVLKKGEEKKMKQEAIAKQLEEIKVLLKKKDDRALRQVDKPLSFKEACAYLGFAPSYLYKLTYRKVIPHYKPTGKMLFFSKCELDEWIFEKRDERSKKKEAEESEDEDAETDSSILRQAQDRLAQSDKGNSTRMKLIKRINAD